MFAHRKARRSSQTVGPPVACRFLPLAQKSQDGSRACVRALPVVAYRVVSRGGLFRAAGTKNGARVSPSVLLCPGARGARVPPPDVGRFGSGCSHAADAWAGRPRHGHEVSGSSSSPRPFGAWPGSRHPVWFLDGGIVCAVSFRDVCYRVHSEALYSVSIHALERMTDDGIRICGSSTPFKRYSSTAIRG